MLNLNLNTKEYCKIHISQIPDYLHRVLIIDGSGSGKTNLLLHLLVTNLQFVTTLRSLHLSLIYHQTGIDKICLNSNNY